MTRAMWKGVIELGEQSLAVKLYAAVEDRSIRFRMLHDKDHAPVEQHIVRKDTGEDVARADIRKAFALNKHTAVILQPEDLAALTPPESRAIRMLRFVPLEAISDQWYDRPYYLGPDGDDPAYFALAQAIADQKAAGIARWVMRKKRYVGALTSIDGYLAMSTLRRADQVLQIGGVKPAAGMTPAAAEMKLAKQLVASIEADFDPAQWQNQYRERVQKLVAAKARGKTLPPVRIKKKAPQVNLADSLRASIASMRERKVA